MGTINEYQRQLPESSAVGTPGVDESGAVIGQSIAGAADALATRQMALDKVQSTNAYYNYAQKDELNRIQLQKQFGEEPLKFADAYAKSSADLAHQFSSQLPDTQQAHFNLLTSRRAAKILPENQKWAFDQQNVLALNGVDKGGSELSLQAQSWANADDYQQGLQDYAKRFKEVDAPLLNQPIQTFQKYVANATQMYVASMLDNNTGNPLQLRNDFENNENFRNQVTEALGVKGFERAYNQSKKQVSSLMSEQTYDMVKDFSFGSAAMAKLDKMFNTPAGIAVGNAQRDVIVTENALASLERSPNAKDYASQIAATKEQLQQNKVMLEIATNRDNIRVKNNLGTVADLQTKIFSAALGISTPKEAEKLQAKSTRDNANAATGGPSLSASTWIGPLGHIVDWISGGGGVTANQDYSNHIQNLYKVKGEILAARNDGQINDKMADTLIKKIAMPLASLNQYDRIQGGDSSFVQAYQAFDKHAQTVSLDVSQNTPPAQMRQIRDNVRSQMVSRFAERLYDMQQAASSMGETFTPGKKGTDLLVKSVIDEFVSAKDPNRYPGLKKGDIVMVNGKPTAFLGYNVSNGQAVHETPDDLDKSLNNT